MKHENILKSIKNQMKVEKNAINLQLESFKKMHGVLKKFDGKIVNQRLYTALSTETGKNVFRDSFYHVQLKEQRAVLITNEGIKKDDSDRYIYPSLYERGELILVVNQDNRLDAESSIVNLNKLIERLEAAREKYTFDEKATAEKIERMEKIGNELEELLKECDYITGQEIRKVNFYIR